MLSFLFFVLRAFIFFASLAAIPSLALFILLFVVFDIMHDEQERLERGDAP